MDERKKEYNFALANRDNPLIGDSVCWKNDSVAQLVEQMTLNHWVVGSSPTGVTRQSGKTLQIAETKTVSAIFVIPLSGRIVNIVRYGGVQFVNS